MLRRSDIDVVGLFLEGITDLDWLPALEDALREPEKRLFVLKAASTAAGGLAAVGHTGRIVGSADASRAILREVGAREVATVGALADALAVSSTCPALLDSPRPRVSIVSVSGAAGVIGADRVANSERLRMAGPVGRDRSAARLDSRLRPANPLDVPFLDETPVFTGAIVAAAEPAGSDVVVVVESGLAHDREDLVSTLIASRLPVPLVLTSLSEDDLVPPEWVARLAEAGIAFVPSIERAVDAVAQCAPTPSASEDDGAEDDGAEDNGAEDDGAAATELAGGRAGVLGLEGAAAYLPADFPWARWHVVADERALPGLVARLGLPLVLKAAGRSIVHRAEAGAVRVVHVIDDLAREYAHVRAVCDRAGDAVVAQRFVPAGLEVMLSAVRDPELGPVAFVRLGGLWAERMSLQTVLWDGWNESRRERVLRRSAVGELLDGYRGGARYDVAALNRLVSQVLAAVAVDAGPLRLLELNPVAVQEIDTGGGVRVIDAVARQ
jgi:acyl-CoA synthetase (NDP forming)